MAVFVWLDFLGPTVVTSTHVLDVTVLKEDASQLARVRLQNTANYSDILI